ARPRPAARPPAPPRTPSPPPDPPPPAATPPPSAAVSAARSSTSLIAQPSRRDHNQPATQPDPALHGGARPSSPAPHLKNQQSPALDPAPTALSYACTASAGSRAARSSLSAWPGGDPLGGLEHPGAPGPAGAAGRA